MHKNLVLDMGNVLVTYDPVWVIQEYTDGLKKLKM